MKYTVEMDPGGMIYIPSFVKIGTGVEGILRFRLRNLNVCKVVTAGSDLRKLVCISWHLSPS
jgi:hypothetical protein